MAAVRGHSGAAACVVRDNVWVLCSPFNGARVFELKADCAPQAGAQDSPEGGH